MRSSARSLLVGWSAPVRTDHEPAAALLAWIERQAASGRSLNQSLYAVRLWLRGTGPGAPMR